MANPFFQFKQFTIQQDLCAMKVGTDGVLLGAWASVPDRGNMLDIGTGTGLIALMMAQRSSAGAVDAIEIDANAAKQALANSLASPFADRICIHHVSFSRFVETSRQKYARIVSNPPYFRQSLKCPNQQRTLARHMDSLSLAFLLEGGCRLLAPEGRIALILPFEQKEDLCLLSTKYNLQIVRQTEVLPTPDTPPKRILAELSASSIGQLQSDTLIIEESRHCYTPQYIALTRDFYLKM